MRIPSEIWRRRDTEHLDQPVSQLTRIFLACDGTLTHLLEAAFSETIDLVISNQVTTFANEDIRSLEVTLGDRIMNRNIILRGSTSNRHFVYAESLIAINSLPHSFSQGLEDKTLPIGELLCSQAIPVQKELLDIKFVFCKSLDGIFQYAPNLITRNYRVFLNNIPVMLITEYFPPNY